MLYSSTPFYPEMIRGHLNRFATYIHHKHPSDQQHPPVNKYIRTPHYTVSLNCMDAGNTSKSLSTPHSHYPRSVEASKISSLLRTRVDPS
ncbi:hypothetical protein ASPCADRAFT_209232, partial [Aspergillus carbonarius ITEM 5010]